MNVNGGVTSPRVSVIIPTYNRARLVVQAIQSVLDQTFRDFELLVVDDASTDDTGQVMRGFEDARLRCLCHTENRGGSAARNTGIEASRAEYVAFLDSDDEWLPRNLELQMAKMEAAPQSVGVVYSGHNVCLVSEDGQARAVKVRRPHLRGDVLDALATGNFLPLPTALVRRACLAAAGSFDETLPSCQDWDLWMRMAALCHFDYVDEVLCNVRVLHGEQISSNPVARLNGLDRMLRKHSAVFARNRKADSIWRRNLGSKYIQLGDVDSARTWLLASVRRNPFHLRAYAQLLLSLLGRGAYVAAMRLSTRRPNEHFSALRKHLGSDEGAVHTI